MGVYHLRIATLVSVLAICAVCLRGQITQQVTSIAYGNVVCQDTRMDLYCPRGYYIRVTEAFYGRRDTEKCSDRSLNNNITVDVNVRCNAIGVKKIVATSCDGRTTCSVTADHTVFVANCPAKTVEYLEVSYVCQQTVYKAFVCEATGVAPIACPEKYGIQTMDAFFGRNSATKCQHPTAMKVTSGCSSATASKIFYQRCNGRNRCELNALGSIFNDSCPGTYKYLEASYTCAECTDLHTTPGECEMWRNWGECQKNAKWMIPHCRKTCTHCSRYPPKCENIAKDSECENWAKNNECEKNPSYMNAMCRRSCLKCDQQGTRCSNFHINCEEWAKAGKCQSDSSYMMQYCKKACTSCSPGDCSNIHNSDTGCWWWASRGECQFNPKWMLKNCYKACTKCQIYDREPACKNAVGDNTCNWWQSRGECYKNPDWMYPNCWKACTSCDYDYAANHILGNDAKPGPSVAYISPTSFIMPDAFQKPARLQYFVGYFGNLNRVKLQIWRPVNATTRKYSVVYEQTARPEGDKHVQVFAVPGCTMVQSGDRLGFTEVDGASPLTYRFNTKPSTPTLFRKADTTGPFDSLFYPFLFSYAAGYDASQTCASASGRT